MKDFDSFLSNSLKRNLNNRSGINLFFVEGDMVMGDKKKAGNIDISGSEIGNLSYQSQNVTQTYSTGTSDLKKELEEIIKRVNQIENDRDREQSELNTEILRSAMENNDTDRVKKVLELLKGSIGTINSLTNIARFFGITL